VVSPTTWFPGLLPFEENLAARWFSWAHQAPQPPSTLGPLKAPLSLPCSSSSTLRPSTSGSRGADAFLHGQFRPDCRLPFLLRDHLPTARNVQNNPTKGSTPWHRLLRRQNRTYTLEDPQPKVLTVVPFAHSVRRGGLPPSRFPPVVRVLVHPYPVHIDRFLALFGASPRGFCPHQTPQPARGGARPLPLP